MILRLLSILIVNIALISLCPKSAWADEEKIYSSQNQQVMLMEVYVSQGCSSCPPAQKWVSKYIDDPQLWREVIPIVFHVDYWDYLGWKDPFASKEFTQRQYQYKANNNIDSVYTPGFIVNGLEWKGWFQKKGLPTKSHQAGLLRAHLESKQLNIAYEGEAVEPELNIAILGFGIQIDVKTGENRNRTLKEDFVVLAHEIYQSENGLWSVPFPKYSSFDAQRYAIVFWVNIKGEFTPIQATGGWLS